MSHVSTTAHYGLPIYGDVDIINPLTDFNDCNTAIDNKLYEVAQGTAGVVTDITDVKNQLGSETLDTASQTVTGAINELKTSEDALDTRVVANETDVATLQAQMSTATTNISNLGTSVAGLQTEMTGKASATALQTLTNKVGTGNLDTQAQNCVDAINEVLSKIPAGGAVKAEDVTYDNTTSGLTATDVQGAIDEVVGKVGNDTLETTAQTITGAINELANSSPSPSREPDVHIVGDGTKTLKTLITEVADAIDYSKITYSSVIQMKRGVQINNSELSAASESIFKWSYTNIANDGSGLGINILTAMCFKTGSGTSYAVQAAFRTGSSSATVTDQSSTVVADGDEFNIYY